MRQIGKLTSEKHAGRFVDHLLTLGIHSKAEPNLQGEWTVWIHEENHVEQAKTELEAFRSSPDDPRYRVASDEAAGIRKMEQLRERERRKNIHDVKPRGNPIAGGLTGAPVTKLVIVICAIIAAIGMFLSNRQGEEPGLGDIVYDSLSFIAADDIPAFQATNDSLRSIKKGEIWRLITPAILHSRSMPFHIFFNMYMLYALGPPLERRLGSFHFFALNIALALASNLAQGYLPTVLEDTALREFSRYYGGVFFLGYSGVLYGFFGYFWIRAKHDLTFGMQLPPSTVMILLGWFVLCWTGFLGPIANLGHTGGLIAGMIAGAIPVRSR